ncbi:hypothetical protein [Pseudomonas pergaminensis]
MLIAVSIPLLRLNGFSGAVLASDKAETGREAETPSTCLISFFAENPESVRAHGLLVSNFSARITNAAVTNTRQ